VGETPVAPPLERRGCCPHPVPWPLNVFFMGKSLLGPPPTPKGSNSQRKPRPRKPLQQWSALVAHRFSLTARAVF